MWLLPPSTPTARGGRLVGRRPIGGDLLGGGGGRRWFAGGRGLGLLDSPAACQEEDEQGLRKMFYTLFFFYFSFSNSFLILFILYVRPYCLHIVYILFTFLLFFFSSWTHVEPQVQPAPVEFEAERMDQLALADETPNQLSLREEADASEGRQDSACPGLSHNVLHHFMSFHVFSQSLHQ